MVRLAFRGINIPKAKSKDKLSPSQPSSDQTTSPTGTASTQQRPTKASKVVKPVDAAPRERQGPVAPIGGDVTQKAAMIKAYAKDRNLQAAKSVFESFRGSNSMLSNSFLDACVQCGDFKQASVHFSDMKRTGHSNVVSYNTIIKGLLTSGDMAAVNCLLAEMAERGLQASHVTFHSILHASVQSGDRDSAWRWMSQIDRKSVV